MSSTRNLAKQQDKDANSSRPNTKALTKPMGDAFLEPTVDVQYGGPLIDAIRDRHFVLAHSILDKNPEYAKTEAGMYGLKPLHWCAYQGRVIPLDLIERILHLYPKAIYKVDSKKRLPLHYALCNSTGVAREEVISLLLRCRMVFVAQS